MTEWNTEELIEPDKRFIWHPFTDMREWCSPEHESLVLVEGRGALLRDSRGREYIDRNSSIWTNIHGHNHPHMMTGSDRTGRMFASEHKGVIPDIQVLGKELTEGYFPLAITLISEKLFSAFDGSVADGKALAYGHGYTGNALGCAAAKASLEVFENERVLEALEPKICYVSSALAGLKELPGVSEVRQCGFIAGIETSSAEMAVANLHRSAAPRSANQTNLECDCSYAAALHYNGSVKESRRSFPGVDHRGLALDQ